MDKLENKPVPVPETMAMDPMDFDLLGMIGILGEAMQTSDPWATASGADKYLTDADRAMMASADVKRLPGILQLRDDESRTARIIRPVQGKPVVSTVPVRITVDGEDRHRVMNPEHLAALNAVRDRFGKIDPDDEASVRYFAKVYCVLFAGSPNRKGSTVGERNTRNALLNADGRTVIVWADLLRERKALRSR